MEEHVKQELEIIHSQVCQALGDVTRLMILHTLAQKPKCVGDLAEELGVPQPTVSRHLKVLRERSLVETKREGTTIYYSLSDDRLLQVLEMLRGIVRDRLMKQAQMFDAITAIRLDNV